MLSMPHVYPTAAASSLWPENTRNPVSHNMSEDDHTKYRYNFAVYLTIMTDWLIGTEKLASIVVPH